MKEWQRLGISLVLSALAIFGLVWSNEYSVPDLVQLRYGFPLMWGTRTLDTIAGPVDRWYVDPTVLTIDLVFWLGLILVLQLLLGRYSRS